MSSDTKEYAKSVLSGYSDMLSRITKHYTSSLSQIDQKHDAINARIDEEARQKKNIADAKNKVSLHNTKANLLEKGLAKSGQSAQADIDHNLARSYAFAAIDSEAEESKRENEATRASAKSSAKNSYSDSMNSMELQRNKAYTEQLNADRAYQADRDDEAYDRAMQDKKYQADRDDEAYDRAMQDKKFQADRDDESYRRYADERDYQSDRDDEMYDRYADERDYKAEREDESYDRYISGLKTSSEDSSSTDGTSKRSPGETARDGEKTVGGNIVPEISVKEFVKQISEKYYTKNFGSQEEREEKVKKVITTIVYDQALDSDYRYELKVYAKALGLI